MKGESIPNKDHVARYCRPMQLFEGNVQGSAFILRDNEDSLSVDWLEIFNCQNRADEIADLKKVYRSRFNRIGASAKIAILNVGQVSDKVLNESADKRKLKIFHDPLEDDISHSGINNLKPDNELIAELIIETILETYPAR
jgi:hypothetical protein